jgi:ferredoxin
MEGERFRCWDSCQFPEFSRMAGGIDPRPLRKERFIQRFYHKFCYARERHGKVFCTGCGRCIRFCPVNIDVTAILRDVTRLGEGKE